MAAIETVCNSSCGRGFKINEMPTEKLKGGIEKTYFTCPHCQEEYICFYTDEEIRKLQMRIRRVQSRFADPNDNHKDAAHKEAELQATIKVKMEELKQRVESV